MYVCRQVRYQELIRLILIPKNSIWYYGSKNLFAFMGYLHGIHYVPKLSYLAILYD